MENDNNFRRNSHKIQTKNLRRNSSGTWYFDTTLIATIVLSFSEYASYLRHVNHVSGVDDDDDNDDVVRGWGWIEIETRDEIKFELFSIQRKILSPSLSSSCQSRSSSRPDIRCPWAALSLAMAVCWGCLLCCRRKSCPCLSTLPELLPLLLLSKMNGKVEREKSSDSAGKLSETDCWLCRGSHHVQLLTSLNFRI